MPAQALLRPALWLGFFAVILWAWWLMYAMTAGMGMTLTGSMKMADGMSMGMGQSMAMTSPGVLIPMWVIMMAAMMGPTFVPTARTYEDLIGSGAGTRAGFIGLIAGYLAVWFGFGAAIAVAHYGFLRLGLLSNMGGSTSLLFSAVLLGVAGAYQFTKVKDVCLGKCRTPMTYFLGHWRGGLMGGARMGAGIGAYCVVCCWAIMSLGFVGGAMNLIWMGIATLIMTLEKLPDLGRWLTRPLGVAFLAAAAWHLSKLI